jgi:hypothetical protein
MTYHCPTPDCEATEYVMYCLPFPGDNVELGVIVDRQGNPTNRWEDGIAGVPEDIQDGIRMDDCAPYCHIHDAETEWR